MINLGKQVLSALVYHYLEFASHVLHWHRWNNQDLEHVIEHGDQLYKYLNCFSFLYGAEIPKQVLVQHIPLDLKL